MNDDELRELMYREADAAEAAPDEDDGQPLPAHVKVSRPNAARSKVLQVRLNPEEFAAVEAIAERRGLPASTVARERLLQMVREEQGSVDAAAELVAVAARINELVALVAERSAARTSQVS